MGTDSSPEFFDRLRKIDAQVNSGVIDTPRYEGALCQRVILDKVCSRKLDDDEIDSQLIKVLDSTSQQLDDDEQNSFQNTCAVMDCNRTADVSVDPNGVISLEQSEGLCREVSVLIGKSAISNE